MKKEEHHFIKGKQRAAMIGFMLAGMMGLFLLALMTPSSMEAQNGGGNSSRNNENTNCPNYTYSTNTTCPSITNNGAINEKNFCYPHMPELTNEPGAAEGQQVITTTETCSNIVTESTNTITYSFSGLKYDPAPPNGHSVAGTYVSDCYVKVTSSDKDDCPPSPDKIDYGDVTWIVSPSGTTTESVDFPDIDKLSGSLKKLATRVPFCKSIEFSVNGQLSVEVGNECCDKTDPPSIVTYTKYSGGVNGSLEITLAIPGWSWQAIPPFSGEWPIHYKIWWDATVGPKFTISPTLSLNASGKTTDPDCGGCFTAGLDFNCPIEVWVGGEFKAYVELFDSGHWYTFRGRVDAELGGSAGTSFGGALKYSRGTDCDKTGVWGQSVSWGGLDITLTAKLTVKGYGFSWSHSWDLFEGGKWPED